MFSYWMAWMSSWWFSSIFFASCCQTWWNNTLQQSLLKSFAFGCWLESNSSCILSWLIHRSCFCESLGQLTVVTAVDANTNWCLCWTFLPPQWCMITRLADFSYRSAFHTSPLPFHTGLPLIITRCRSIVLKVDGRTEDILLYTNPRPGYGFCNPKEL